MSSGIHIVRVMTDDGEHFACFSDTAGQFVSPCCSTPQALASWADAVMPIFQEGTDWVKACSTTDKVFDLRRSTIHQAVGLIAQLKRGVPLSDQEALQVDNLYRFLEGTIEVTLGQIELITQLKTDDLDLPTGDELIDFVIDGMYPVFGAQATSLRGISVFKDSDPPTRAELIIVGRYLSRLALIARIAGTDRLSPCEIVQKYYYRDERTSSARRILETMHWIELLPSKTT